MKICDLLDILENDFSSHPSWPATEQMLRVQDQQGTVDQDPVFKNYIWKKIKRLCTENSQLKKYKELLNTKSDAPPPLVQTKEAHQFKQHDDDTLSITTTADSVFQILSGKNSCKLVLPAVASVRRVLDPKNKVLIYGNACAQRFLLQIRLCFKQNITAAKKIQEVFEKGTEYKNLNKSLYDEVSNFWLNGYHKKLAKLIETQTTSPEKRLASAKSGKVPICTSELRYLFREWDRFRKWVSFYDASVDGQGFNEVSPPWERESTCADWAEYAIYLQQKQVNALKKMKHQGLLLSQQESVLKEMTTNLNRKSFQTVVDSFHKAQPGRTRLTIKTGIAYRYIQVLGNDHSKAKNATNLKSPKETRGFFTEKDTKQDRAEKFQHAFFEGILGKAYDFSSQLSRPGCKRKSESTDDLSEDLNRSFSRFIVSKMCKVLLEKALYEDYHKIVYSLQGLNLKAVAKASPIKVTKIEKKRNTSTNRKRSRGKNSDNNEIFLNEVESKLVI